MSISPSTKMFDYICDYKNRALTDLINNSNSQDLKKDAIELFLQNYNINELIKDSNDLDKKAPLEILKIYDKWTNENVSKDIKVYNDFIEKYASNSLKKLDSEFVTQCQQKIQTAAKQVFDEIKNDNDKIRNDFSLLSTIQKKWRETFKYFDQSKCMTNLPSFKMLRQR